MINPQTPVLRGVLVLAASLLAHACGTDTVRCPPSQALFEGRCVDFEDTDEGTRRPADAGDTEDNDGADSQTDVPGTGDGGCEGVAPVCDGADTVVECGPDGELVRRLCEDGSSCSGGQCLGDGQICEPGAVTGCATPASYLECNAEGTATDERPCPVEAPNCRGGACTDSVCDAGERRCRGLAVLECESGGSAEVEVEACERACVDGACRDEGCITDGKQYLGCGFWAVYLDNEARGLGFAVAISNPESTSVDVSVTAPDGSLVSSQRIAPGEIALVSVPDAAQIDGSSLTRNAYQIGSSGPVTVHQFNPPNNLVEGYSNDASLLLPSTALGQEYLVMGWTSGDDLGRFAGLSARTYVTIVAVDEGTTQVTVQTPTAVRAGTGVATIAAGATQVFSLTQGDVLTLQTERNDGDDPDTADPADMTGMRITGDRNLAVFSGSEASYIPDDTGPADHLEQQLYPIDTWGNDYYVTKFSPRGTEPDVFRVMVRDAGTTLRTDPVISGVDGRTLGAAGDAVEFEFDRSFRVWSESPISVGQFMVGSLYPGIPSCTRSNTSGCAIPLHPACDNLKRIGDPAFLLPVPAVQYRSDYLVLVPEGYAENFAGVASPAGTTVLIDGVASSAPATAIGGTGWEVRNIPLAPGTHRVSASVGIGVSIHGYGCDVSYAYPGGLNLESAP